MTVPIPVRRVWKQFKNKMMDNREKIDGRVERKDTRFYLHEPERNSSPSFGRSPIFVGVGGRVSQSSQLLWFSTLSSRLRKACKRDGTFFIHRLIETKWIVTGEDEDLLWSFLTGKGGWMSIRTSLLNKTGFYPFVFTVKTYHRRIINHVKRSRRKRVQNQTMEVSDWDSVPKLTFIKPFFVVIPLSLHSVRSFPSVVSHGILRSLTITVDLKLWCPLENLSPILNDVLIRLTPSPWIGG